MLQVNPGSWQLFMQQRAISAVNRRQLQPLEDKNQPLTLAGTLLTWFSALLAVEIGVFLVLACGGIWRPAPAWLDRAVLVAVFVAPFALTFLPSLFTRISIWPVNGVFFLSAFVLAPVPVGMLIMTGLLVGGSTMGAIAGNILRRCRIWIKRWVAGRQP